jgi:hypothetical protein
MCLGAVAAVGPSPSLARAPDARAPFLLANVPSIGQVWWRCGEGVRRSYGLGVRIDRLGAETYTRYRAASRRSIRTLEPGQTVWFPTVPVAVRKLTLLAGNSARSIRATITVRFDTAPNGQPNCWDYFPPQMTMTLTTTPYSRGP